MSTRDKVFRAELAHILLRHGGSQQIETAVIRLHREHLAAAESRAADLEAGIRSLAAKWDEHAQGWADTNRYQVANVLRSVSEQARHLVDSRALVGDETTPEATP